MPSLQPKTRSPSIAKKLFRFVDLGFGSEADHLRAFAVPNPKADLKRVTVRRVLLGVEQPRAPRIRIPDVRLSYQGFDRWVTHVKNRKLHVVNADFFFNNYLPEKSPEKRIVQLQKLRENMVIGGRLFATVRQWDLPLTLHALRQAGFQAINHRPLTEEETTTSFRLDTFNAGQHDSLEQPILIRCRRGKKVPGSVQRKKEWVKKVKDELAR